VYICDHTLTVCYHDIFEAACRNFAEFTVKVQLENYMTWLHFEVKRSKVKVTAIPNIFRKAHWEFWSLNFGLNFTGLLAKA